MGNSLQVNVQKMTNCFEATNEKSTLAKFIWAVAPECTSDVAKIKSLLKRFEPKNLRPGTKTDEGVEALLESARRSIHNGYWQSALDDVNKALILLPKNASHLLCTAFTLRAEVLLAERRYRACALDADRALHFASSEDVEVSDHLANLLQQCEGAGYSDLHQEKEKASLALETRNPLVPCASGALKLVDQRFVAAREIRPGEVLMVEEPPVSFKVDSVAYRCNHCLRETRAPLPCDDCTQRVFCNEECKKADHMIHSQDCQLNSVVPSTDDDVALAHFRWLLVIAKAMELIDSEPDARLGKWRTLKSGDLDALLIRSAGGAASQTLPADLQHVIKILGLQQQLPKEEFDRLVTALPLVINCITRATYSVEGVTSMKGRGIYTNMALVTFACSPNAAAFFVGPRLVLQATRTIPKGALITQRSCQNSNFLKVRRPLRWYAMRENLALGANKECACEACIYDWPMLDQLENGPNDQEIKLLLGRQSLDSELFVFALQKTGEMEQNRLQRTKEFHQLQELIRAYMITQGI